MKDDDSTEEKPIESEATEEERREAEALSRALDRGYAAEALPEDALSVAALLRYGRDGGNLELERQQAIWEGLLASGGPPHRAPEPRRRWWLALLSALTAGAVAAGALVLVWTRTDSEEPLRLTERAAQDEAPSPAVGEPSAASMTDSARTELPEPPPSLLVAQARVLEGQDGAANDLRAQMRAYRGVVYAALTERYAQR